MGDSHNINNGMRAADGSGDTQGLQQKAPSRGMRYLVNITNKFMLPQETHHHLLVRIHFETRTRREKKAPHAPMDPWLTCRRLGWYFFVVYCSMLQLMGVEAKARACLLYTSDAADE